MSIWILIKTETDHDFQSGCSGSVLQPTEPEHFVHKKEDVGPAGQKEAA